MAQPRLALEFSDPYTKNFPLHANAVATAGLIEVGDFVKYTSTGSAATAGLELIGTSDLTINEKFVGISRGKSLTTFVSGATGDYLPVCMKCIVECDLASAAYIFGEGLGLSATKNTLLGAVATTNPTVAWYWGSDSGTITRGLVMVDIPLLQLLLGAKVAG